MNRNCIVVDLQGFKDCLNNFIVKEFALATKEHTQVFLIKPPYLYSNLSLEEKRQVSWLERERGIYWSEGFIDYREFKRTIIPFLENSNVLVKGFEKIKWVKELCVNCSVEDIGERGCPNFLSLYNEYCQDNKYNCVFHKKNCALKNVVIIKKWCTDNKIM